MFVVSSKKKTLKIWKSTVGSISYYESTHKKNRHVKIYHSVSRAVSVLKYIIFDIP